ncbi:MAG: barstar family protein [Oscillospiraceae bacterium]|nr:barstar family protein [Oscillospiraceae bacterium]
MKSFILYGGAIADRDELHETLAMGLGFPEYYGKNLDALHDCLADISRKRRS